MLSLRCRFDARFLRFLGGNYRSIVLHRVPKEAGFGPLHDAAIDCPRERTRHAYKAIKAVHPISSAAALSSASGVSDGRMVLYVIYDIIYCGECH